MNTTVLFYRILVHEALKRTCTKEKINGSKYGPFPEFQDTEISSLIHDIFGCEILKTRKDNGWHFYNRIDGERIDFANHVIIKPADDKNLEDIPVSPAETSEYLGKEDYFAFFYRFIIVFEELVGLRRLRLA